MKTNSFASVSRWRLVNENDSVVLKSHMLTYNEIYISTELRYSQYCQEKITGRHSRLIVPFGYELGVRLIIA